MSRKDTILKAARRTAQEARAAASRRKDTPARRHAESGAKPHRHCVVCWTPIPLDSDPPICSKDDCATMQDKKERSRRRLTFMMYLFPAIAVFFVILEVVGASG